MKIQSLLLCSTLLCCIFIANAQEIALPEIIPSSPTVANLMAFEEVPIDYYTGQPNIAIPLCSKKLNGSLGLNVSLQYHTSGVKIDNISGWTGTGWSLTAGGSISRTVRGTPDEAQKGMNSNKTGVLHNPDFWNYDALTINDKNLFNWNAIGSPGDLYDSQLDLYQFNALGVTGRFVVVLENGVLKAKLLTKNQNIKILINYNSTTYVINSFELTDTLGHRYLFDITESSVSNTFYGYVPQGGGGGNIPTPGPQDDPKYTAWHLSTISNSNLVTLATFNYNTVNEAYEASFTRVTNTPTTALSYQMTEDAYNQSILEPMISISALNMNTDSKKISNIVFKDGTSIDFLSSAGHPEMNPGTGNKLTDVIIKNADGSEDKRYTLLYEITNRLWLDKVNEIANGVTFTTDLTYFNKSDLPTRSSAQHADSGDNWGYNSGYSNTNSTCGLGNNYNTNAIRVGLLTSILYPTNGLKEFEFEAHTYAYKGDSLLSSEDFSRYNPLNVDAQSITYPYNYNSSNPGVILPQFTIPYEQEVVISNNLNNSNANGLDIIRIVIVDATTNTTLLQRRLDANDCGRFNLAAGTYKFGVSLIIPSQNSYIANGTAELMWTEPKSSGFKEEALGGGVRIKEIRFNDQKNPQAPERTTRYLYNEEGNPNRSSGSVDSKIGSITNEYNKDISKHLFSETGGSFGPSIINYNVKTKGTTAQLTRGGYVGYKHVRMEESGNGYSTFTYTSPQDFPSPQKVFEYPYHPAPNLDYKRGLLLEQKTYDEGNRILKETENTLYTYQDFTEAPGFKIYDDQVCPWKQFYSSHQFFLILNPDINAPPIGLANFQNCGEQSGIVAFKDNLTSGWAQLKERVSKEYFYEGTTPYAVEERQTFDYNTTNFQQSVVDRYIYEQGVEEHYKTELFYAVGGVPSDYVGNAVVTAKMQNLNMINLPLYTKNSLNGTLLSTTQNVFKEYYTNKIDLEQIQTIKVDAALDERITYASFDHHGNPQEVAITDGPPVSYVWGYNRTLPVAQIQNASYADVTATGVNFSILNNPLSSEAAKRIELDKIRNNLPEALVTTYTYDLLAGVSTSTNPRGYTMTYHYDAFNRLQFVKDALGQLISENQYNYKNQN